MGTSHLGKGAAGGATSGTPHDMASMAEREAFVQRWHTGKLGFAVELNDAFIGEPLTKFTQSSRPRAVIVWLAWESGRRFPMIVSSM